MKKEGKLTSGKNCPEAPALLQEKLSLKEVVPLSPSWWREQGAGEGWGRSSEHQQRPSGFFAAARRN